MGFSSPTHSAQCESDDTQANFKTGYYPLHVALDKFLPNATLRLLEESVVLARLILFAFLANLPCTANAQCVPKPYSAKQEVFSSVVQNLDVSGVKVGPAGIELLLKERDERVQATLRDYEGSPFPLETILEGGVHESATGCDVSLSGHGKRGKVEIRGTITVANFRGTIRRHIGKETLSESLLLRRKLGESNDHQEAGGIAPFLQTSPTGDPQTKTGG